MPDLDLSRHLGRVLAIPSRLDTARLILDTSSWDREPQAKASRAGPVMYQPDGTVPLKARGHDVEESV